MKKIFQALVWMGWSTFFGFNAYGDSGCQALIVVGMEDEYAIATGDEVTVVTGTANATRLRERLKQVDTSHISRVFSFGVAGALDPVLKPGDLLISRQVLSQINNSSDEASTDVNWPVDQNLLLTTFLKAGREHLDLRKGTFLGTDHEAREQSSETMTHLYQMTGAHIIDNETHIAAQFASEHNLPFLSIRAVSDSVYNPLPPAALLPLDPEDGSPDGMAIVKSILMNPLQIPALVRTAREYRKALKVLREFRNKVGFLSADDQSCLKGKREAASSL